MNKIKLFNHNLNNSLDYQSKSKELFADQVSLLLRAYVDKINARRSVCIIGSGKMEDFSLSFFVKRFEEVFLTDIDTDTVQKAVNDYHFTKKEKNQITIKQVEYTGFEEDLFFDDFKERIVNARTFEKIDQILDNKLENIKQFTFMEEYKNRFDFIYVSPIYTQLIYNQVLRECSILRESGYPEHLIKYIENRMLDEMIGIIDRFNKNIISLLEEKGTLFVLSDVFQVDIGSKFDLRVQAGIKSRHVMDEIYEGYISKFGMGLGDYGLFSLDREMKSLVSRWMIWPFTEKVNFVIKVKIYNKK